MNDQFKGYILAFISVLSVSNVYIFSKAALNEVSLAQFGVYWFGFGLIWIVFYGIYKKSFLLIKTLNKRKYKLFILLGLIEIFATTFFFKSIHVIANPAITSFLNNISPVFVLSLSFIFLKERLNKLEIIGAFIAIMGGFIIGYQGGFDITNMFLDGTQYIVLASLLFATSSVISKRHITTLSPVLIAFNRTLFLWIFSLIVLYNQDLSIQIPTTATMNILIGSVLGPFLTAVTGLLALKYIDLSKKSIISGTKSLFVLFGSFLYFDIFPKSYELLGGLISIAGVLLIIFGKTKIITNRTLKK